MLGEKLDIWMEEDFLCVKVTKEIIKEKIDRFGYVKF